MTNFTKFHRANPKVFGYFCQFADEVRQVYKQYGVAAVWERVRWHCDIDTSGDQLKCNNNYKAYYARMYMIYRNCPDFFQTQDSLADVYNFTDEIEYWKGTHGKN